MNIYQRLTLVIGGVIISIIIFSTLSNVNPADAGSLRNVAPGCVLLAFARGVGVLVPILLIFFAFNNLKGKKNSPIEKESK